MVSEGLLYFRNTVKELKRLFQTNDFSFCLLIEHPAESLCAGVYQADGGFGCS